MKIIIWTICLTLIFNACALPAMAWTSSRETPQKLEDEEFMFPSFTDGEVVLDKVQGRLPAMGWNSWNAFGSANNETTTKAMAESFIRLGLDRLGYEYIVLDDGCYKSTRVDGKLSNDTTKFPSGFKALGDYIHARGLKFGMYNDIGTNLCAGSAVGTVGYEDVDAKTYKEWGVDFLKVDNCYYLWDNATFSGNDKARYSYAPNIRSISVKGNGMDITQSAVSDGILKGDGAVKNTSGNYVTNIGTKDGTNVGTSPVGYMWSELEFCIDAPVEGEYTLTVDYAAGAEAGVGQWLQVGVGPIENEVRYYDDLLSETGGKTTFKKSQPIIVKLNEGENIIRLMNHRRQENVLLSYGALLDSLNKYDKNHNTVLSICEWGKTQPQDWGYKVGDSWRILNDITFSVGVNGSAKWSSNNTASITSQYNKAVIMDEFSGLDKGWNDPDMLVIGMSGISEIMSKTHMTMWCMMNSPLMLGLDLRKVEKGDAIYNIIANEKMIALNQDPLGIQAKRVYSSLEEAAPDTTYIENNDRVDILAKPLANGDVAISFINLKSGADNTGYEISAEKICSYLEGKMVNGEEFKNAECFIAEDLWTGEVFVVSDGKISVNTLDAYDNVTVRVSPLKEDGAAEKLKGKIEELRSLLENNKAESIIAADEELERAIEKAEAAYENADLTASEIAEEIVAVNEAEKNYIEVYKERDTLKNEIINAERVLEDAVGGSESLYIKSVAEALERSIESCKGVVAASSSVKADFEDAVNTLLSATEEFEKSYEKCYRLKNEIRTAEAMLTAEDDYINDDNMENLKVVYEGAMEVYASAGDEAEISDAIEQIKAARLSVGYDTQKVFEPDAWYTFDDCDNTVVRDVSGNGMDATLKQSGAAVNEIGTLSLNKNNENNGFLQLPEKILSGAEEFTFAAWVKQDESRAWARLFDFGMSSSNGYMFFAPYVNNNLARYAITNAGSGSEEQLNTTAFNDGEWQHFAIKQEKGTVSIYINGIKTAQKEIAKTPAGSIKTAQKCYIGKSQYNDPYFKGEIKDVKIYSKSLSDEQIAGIMSIKGLDFISTEASHLTVKYCDEPELPETVVAKTTDGRWFAVDVEWDEYDKELLNKGKDFVIYGNAEGVDEKAELYIKIVSESLHDSCALKIDTDENVGFTVANIDNKEHKFNLVVAEYDSDGNLKEVKTKNVKLEKDEYEKTVLTLDDINEENTVKAFVWNEEHKPMSSVVSIGAFRNPLWTVKNKVADNTEVIDKNSVSIVTERGDFWGRKDNTATVKNVYLTPVSKEDAESFTVSVRVKFKPEENYQRAALVVYLGDGNLVSVMRRYHSSYNGNVFMTTMNTNGSAGSENIYTKDNAADECILKITKAGADFYGYFSIDNGESWNELETRVQEVINSADEIYVGFYASNGDQDAQSAAVTFEDFNFNGVNYGFSNVK